MILLMNHEARIQSKPRVFKWIINNGFQGYSIRSRMMDPICYSSTRMTEDPFIRVNLNLYERKIRPFSRVNGPSRE